MSMLDIKPQRQTVVNGPVLRSSAEWIQVEVQSACNAQPLTRTGPCRCGLDSKNTKSYDEVEEVS